MGQNHFTPNRTKVRDHADADDGVYNKTHIALAHNVMVQFINGVSTFNLNLSKYFNLHLRHFKTAP